MVNDVGSATGNNVQQPVLDYQDQGPCFCFTKYRLIRIPAWIRNYIHNKEGDEITWRRLCLVVGNLASYHDSEIMRIHLFKLKRMYISGEHPDEKGPSGCE